MSLKMMKNTLLVSAFVAASSFVAVGCGDSGGGDGDKKDSGSEPDDEDAGEEKDAGTGPATQDRGGTLVPITAADTSAPILVSHRIVVIESNTGKPLVPALTAMTSTKDGTWTIKGIPTAVPYAFHIEGQGDDKTGYYDSVILNVTAKSPDDPLTRISSASTASIAGQTGGFTSKPEAAAMSGGIYVLKDGKRVGAIGCAQVYLDDEPHPSTANDQRYIDANSLPTTLEKQTATLKGRGTFFFGNIAKGKHKIKVTVDKGKTFFGETEFFIGLSRADAVSNYKAVLYQIGLDIDGDKTPADCM